MLRILQALFLMTMFGALFLGAGDTFAAGSKIFVVNSIADEPDELSGDGKCSSIPSQKCTLRAAIMEANGKPGADLIVLPAGNTFMLARVGTDNSALLGDLDITDDVTLLGGSDETTVVDGAQLDRVFEILNSANVSMARMTIRNGKTNTDGGGLRVSQGGTVDLRYMRLTENIAATYGGGLTLAQGTVTIANSLIKLNTAQSGGGIDADDKLILRDVELTANTALIHGGGIYASSHNGVEIYDSAITSNQAASGGGIKNQYKTTLVNSTIAKNRANYDGGGIYNAAGAASEMHLYNVTISENSADNDSNDSGDGGGVFVGSNSVVTLRNSVLALNNDKSSGGGLFGTSKPHECSGALTSEGYNLLRNNYACTGLTNNVNGDQVGAALAAIDAKLGNLGFGQNGTEKYFLQADSPVVDAANPNGCTDAAGSLILTDQENNARPGGGSCDIGASEYNSDSAKPPAPFLTRPYPGQILKNTAVTFEWLDGETAHNARIQIRQDAPNGLKVASAKNIDIMTFIKTLAPGHTYYWQVSSCNPAGCTKSVWQMFKIK